MNKSDALVISVGTRKGAFLLVADKTRRKWRVQDPPAGPHFYGQIVNHVVLDSRDQRTLMAAARPGHLGPSVYRSTDFGATWQEAKTPPAFPAAVGLAVSHVFWLTPGHQSEPGTWYAGTSPQGLFRSRDAGETWQSVDGFNLHPRRRDWCGDPTQDAPPDGATLHSINVDPHDSRHLLIGMSAGGVFESFDAGESWTPLNAGCAGDFLPDPDQDYGHDPHCVRMHREYSQHVYQQNHCGIYRLDSKGGQRRWTRIGDNMPKAIGDIGFPMVLHPRDPKKLWVFPMDGGSVWPRVSLGGKPAVYGSSDAGETWRRLDKGLPKAHGWFTVKRQAMCADDFDEVGLYFGTTGGEVWASFNEGRDWHCLIQHLPHIYSVEAARL
ncbi:MAG: glycosyl hydrolase [Burkholderiales bacterium]|nr:glycosyl hydrolase [Burkholderiales bacterium]